MAKLPPESRGTPDRGKLPIPVVASLTIWAFGVLYGYGMTANVIGRAGVDARSGIVGTVLFLVLGAPVSFLVFMVGAVVVVVAWSLAYAAWSGRYRGDGPVIRFGDGPPIRCKNLSVEFTPHAAPDPDLYRAEPATSKGVDLDVTWTWKGTPKPDPIIPDDFDPQSPIIVADGRYWTVRDGQPRELFLDPDDGGRTQARRSPAPAPRGADPAGR